MNDLIFEIGLILNDLPRSERAFAQAVIESPSALEGATLQKLAYDTGTSDATIIRFCKRLGFSGINDFKIAITEAGKTCQNVDGHLFSNLDTTDIMKEVYRSTLYILNDTMAQATDKYDKVKIPLGLFHQFMPKQYEKISKGELEYSSRSIVKDFIKTYIDDYSFACKSSADRGEKMYDIVTIGEILVEVLTNRIGQPFTESGYLRGPYPSGAPAIFIDQAALCGARTAIISKIGNDDFGKINMKRLIEDGVDTTQVICTKDNTTATAFVTCFADGERQFIFHFSHAACGELAPENVNEEVIKKSRVLHIMGCSITGSPSMGEAIMKAVRIAAENNVKIAFDPNIRPELYHGRVADFYEEILGYCDFLLTGKNEISLLCPNIENPIDYLVGEKERIVVVKDGSKGASLYTKKIRLRAPVFPANQVDPTGAGDSFDGTFLALMCDGYFLEDCMLYAAAAGAKAVEKRGPMEGNISFEELKKFVSDNPNLKVEKF